MPWMVQTLLADQDYQVLHLSVSRLAQQQWVRLSRLTRHCFPDGLSSHQHHHRKAARERHSLDVQLERVEQWAVLALQVQWHHWQASQTNLIVVGCACELVQFLCDQRSLVAGLQVHLASVMENPAVVHADQEILYLVELAYHSFQDISAHHWDRKEDESDFQMADVETLVHDAFCHQIQKPLAETLAESHSFPSAACREKGQAGTRIKDLSGPNAKANSLEGGAGMVEMVSFQVESEDQDCSVRESRDSEKYFDSWQNRIAASEVSNLLGPSEMGRQVD
jgi:hypothetical protein